MATTRIIPMHNNKGKTISQSLKARIDYVKNPEKTNGGELITAYACSPETADAEFLLARNEYLATTGRTHRNEVIAYQLRQSFKPGEVTPEEANQIGSLPSSRWQLIKWAKPLLLYMKMVCAHIIGTDHFLFNVAGVVIFFYIVLITIEPV